MTMIRVVSNGLIIDVDLRIKYRSRIETSRTLSHLDPLSERGGMKHGKDYIDQTTNGNKSPCA